MGNMPVEVLTLVGVGTFSANGACAFGRLFAKAGLVNAMGCDFINIRDGCVIELWASQVSNSHGNFLHAGLGIECSKDLAIGTAWIFNA